MKTTNWIFSGILVFLMCVGTAFAGTTNIWTENFESSSIWDGWSVDNGVWEVGAPTTGPVTNSLGFRTHEGSNCAATVLTGNYPANTSSRLIRTTPFVVPSAAQNPRLQFWHWYQFSGNSYGVVQIKYGTNAWVDLSPHYSGTASGVWTRPVVDLKAYAGKAVQLAFRIVADGSVNDGWDIDEVSVIKGDITVGFTDGLTESFETGIGDWSSETGTWEVGVPTSGPGSAHSGTNCLATVLRGNYFDGLESRFVSPSFVVPNADQNPRLRFWHWYSFNGGDYGQVQIRTNNGSWQAISRSYVDVSSGIWSSPSFDLSAYAGQTVQLGFFFHSQDVNNDGADTSAGWYIDDLTIRTGPYQGLVANQGESFELGLGDWYVDGGTWEVGKPTSGPNSAHSGTNVAATVLSGEYSDGLYRWSSGVNSSLISPSFVVPNVGEHPCLRFWHWFSFAGCDYGQVYIIATNASWQMISTYSGNGGVWSFPSVDLSVYAGQTVQIAFYFHSEDCNHDGAETSAGWYIDDVQIVSATPAPGIVQFTDARYFVNAGETNALVSMERKFGSSGAVDVTFVATDGTAAGGVDFDSVVDTIHWDDGEQGIKTDIVPIHANSAVRGNKTVTLQLSVPGAFASSVARENATLVIVDSYSPPLSTVTNIGYLRTLEDANGVPTDTNSLFTVEGTVTTWTNLSTNTSDELFFMQDDTNGIAVLFRGGTNQFMPQAGDRLQVCASLTNMNGLLTLAPNYARTNNYVWRLSTSNALPAPAMLDFVSQTNTALMESTEARYVAASQVKFDQTVGSVFPTVLTNLIVTNVSGKKFCVTIHPNTDIAGKPIPATSVTILGVLNQNDSTSPYTTNYALLPTRYADIQEANVAPVLPVLDSVTVNEQSLLTVTNTATDANARDTLTYALLVAPVNATIDDNGIIRWTPSEAQGPSTNTFTTVVIDNGSPNMSATNTFVVYVNEVNSTPVLPIQTNRTINELTLLTVTNTATDSDIPANSLTYALIAAPVNATIDDNGIIRWTPSEAQGPSANTFTTVVIDNGSPNMSATNTFVVYVNEVNSAPVLPAQPNRTIYALTLLTVTNTASDQDIPKNTLTYQLIEAPTNAAINAYGVINWIPSESQAQTTNTIITVVTDDGIPAMSTTNSLVVVVKPTVRMTGAVLDSGNFQFGFTTVAGVDYTIEFSTDLNKWESVIGFEGTGAPMSFYEPSILTNAHGFYRVKIISH
jgi:hypothetical protein